MSRETRIRDHGAETRRRGMNNGYRTPPPWLQVPTAIVTVPTVLACKLVANQNVTCSFCNPSSSASGGQGAVASSLFNMPVLRTTVIWPIQGKHDTEENTLLRKKPTGKVMV